METVGSYKMSFELKKDKTYQIRQQNIYFDQYARENRINTSEGKLSDEEFDQLSELIFASRLLKMNDAYGFDQEPDPDNPFGDLIYQIIYKEGRKTKYISIRSNEKDKFPEPFLQLLRFLSNCISKHAPETSS